VNYSGTCIGNEMVIDIAFSVERRFGIISKFPCKEEKRKNPLPTTILFNSLKFSENQS